MGSADELIYHGRGGSESCRRHAVGCCVVRALVCLQLCGIFVCETVEFLVVEAFVQFVVSGGNALKFLSTWHVLHVLSRRVWSFWLNFIQSANALTKYRWRDSIFEIGPEFVLRSFSATSIYIGRFKIFILKRFSPPWSTRSFWFLCFAMSRWSLRIGGIEWPVIRVIKEGEVWRIIGADRFLLSPSIGVSC